jgi:hypothetical protein
MRKTARALVLGFLAILTSVVLGVASAFMAAFALGAATALIVPGTGTPNANNVADYLQHAGERYIAPFVNDSNGPVCTSTNKCNLVGIDYPASFFPLGFIGNWCPGYSCDTWNESVGTGVENLDKALRDELAKPCPETGCEPIILFGYSQGGAVVSNELRNIGDLTPDELKRLSVVVIGNAYNPDGGIFTRLGFLATIPPPLDITFGPPMPTDSGVPITSIGFEYDPVMYAPLYWGNPFAMLNALAAFGTVHGYYLTPNGNGPKDPIAYGYTEEELKIILAEGCPGANCRVDSNGNKYYMIPAKTLPIMDLIMSVVPAPLRPVVQPFVDLVSPALKVLIDLGYDWSGDPGVPRTLSILPFNPTQDWAAVGVKLIAAAIQGIQAFIGDLGGLKSIVPATVAPTSTTPVSMLAAARTTSPTETTEQISETKLSTSRLTLVEDSETTVQQTTVENDGTLALVDETPVTKPEDTPVTKPEEATTPVPTADEKKSVPTADEKKSAPPADEKKADDKKDATDTKDATDKKADTDKKDANDKKADIDKKGDIDKKDADKKDADKKDADSAKAAA